MPIEKEIVIRHKTGLHARPAAIFVQLANKYESDIAIIKGTQRVNGKSIMGILTLAAEKGTKITIVADGEDAKEAMEELSALLLSEGEPDFVS